MNNEPKETKLLILLYVAAPSVIVPDDMNKVMNIVTTALVKPFNCDKRVPYAYVKGQKNIMCFYITKSGSRKKSVEHALRKKLNDMKQKWQRMVGFEITTVPADQIIEPETTDA